MIFVDDAQQIWRIQPKELEYIKSGATLELRVGGVLWRKVDANPQQGEWAIIDAPWHLDGCAIQLGSPTLGWPIEMSPADAHDEWRALNGVDRR